MKKFLSLALLLFGLLATRPAAAQFTFYSWGMDTVVTTSQLTLTASEGYYEVTIKPDTADIFVKVNTMKEFFPVEAGGTAYFGPSDKVTVIYLKSRAFTTRVYIVGLKKVVQSTEAF